jgi:cephalosporin hydroxylase
MEHFYDTIGENWFSYADFYKTMVSLFPDGSHFVEVGSWKGRSAVCMMVEIINSGKKIHFECVDEWKYVPTTEQPVSSQEEFDRVYEEFLHNISSVRDLVGTVGIIRLDSAMASALYENESVDFVFLDAAHHYENVLSDIESWLPKIKKGGIIAGHDYFTICHPGVKKAVDEMFEDRVKFIPKQNVWFLKNE